jgi:aspartyl-tRNA(Asn)/glutamyl-tRNA(Gln) amidotransferase subunit A
MPVRFHDIMCDPSRWLGFHLIPGVTIAPALEVGNATGAWSRLQWIMTDHLTFLPIGALSEMLNARRVGSEALTRQCLNRAVGEGRALNCFITLCPEMALAEARAADGRSAAGQRLGPLDGIPVALKDNIDVANVPTTNGFGGGPLRIPTEDATVTSRLRDAGAIILGKLAMHEGALGATTDNPHHGRTHNPFRHGHSPGGSSGGSGAAVAAGLCYAALGTDTGGSVRIPASWCGLVGLKPSYGVISTHGVVPLSHRLDHVGPLTRTVADATLLLDALAGYDPLCSESRRAPPGGATLPSLSGLRIAVLANFAAERVDQEVSDAFSLCLARLRDAGTRIETITLPAFDPVKVRRACFVRVEAEAAFVHGPLYRQEPDRFSPVMRGYLDYGLRLPATRLLQADRVMEEAAGALNACWDRFDVMLSPTTPQAAPSFDTIPPDNAGTFCGLANAGGYPAISLPMGVTKDGLPMGLQIVAPLHQDRRLLSIAAAVENLLGVGPRPTIAGG